MANILALEWDSREARIVVARRHGTDLTIDHAFSVELAPGETGQTLADTDVGQRIDAALAARRIGRGDALVAVGRSGIELRLLSLPPAPDEELPELVRFQAVRQFSALGDDWPLDFLPVDQQQADMPRSVLAAAIPPELVEQIQQNCEAAQLRVRRLVLRPCAAASLLRRHAERDVPSVRLLVDVLTDEADLTVTVDQTVVFMRTVRLSGDWNSPQQAQTLLGEIRRTRAAVQNQLGGQAVEQIVLCGPDEDHSTLRSQIEQQLELPTVGFDPFTDLSLSHEVRSRPPERPGRYAPLLGILVDECAGSQHAIDFLHPRQKPEPPSRSRLYGMAGAVAACVALALIGYLWMGLRNLNHSIQLRQDELAVLDQDMERTKQIMDRAAEIDRWVSGDVTWLDELTRLSTSLPTAGEVRLTRLQIDADDRRRSGEDPNDRRRRGRIRVDGYARQPGVISDIEFDLRDDYHHTTGGGARRDSHDPDYPWRFNNIEITIDMPESELDVATSTEKAADPPEQPDQTADPIQKPTKDDIDEPRVEAEESAERTEPPTDRTKKPTDRTRKPSDRTKKPSDQTDRPSDLTKPSTDETEAPLAPTEEPREHHDSA